MCTTCLLLVFLEAFINVLFQALTLAIFARVILSWVPIKLPLGLNEFLFIALFALQAVQNILLRVLPPTLPFGP